VVFWHCNDRQSERCYFRRLGSDHQTRDTARVLRGGTTRSGPSASLDAWKRPLFCASFRSREQSASSFDVTFCTRIIVSSFDATFCARTGFVFRRHLWCDWRFPASTSLDVGRNLRSGLSRECPSISDGATEESGFATRIRAVHCVERLHWVRTLEARRGGP